MKTHDKNMSLQELIRALSSRPGLPGLTPVSRSAVADEQSTATIVQSMIDRLRRQTEPVS